MKFSCKGIYLSEAVVRVSKALVNKITDNNILEGIKLTALNDKLVLNATDLEFAIEKSILADVITEGSIVIPGKFLNNLVRNLPDTDIEMELLKDNIMNIRYEGNEVNVQCFEADMFPSFLSMQKPVCIPIKKASLIEIIDKSSLCVSEDDNRPVLKGCKFDIDGDLMTVSSIDGYRLMIVKHSIEKNVGAVSFIVPGKCLTEISRMLDENVDVVNLCIEKNYLMIELKETKISVRLLIGDFMDCQKLVPTSFTTEVVVNKAKIEKALSRVAVVGSAGASNILVYMTITENNMVFYTRSELGQITENIEVKKQGKDLEITFDLKYLNGFFKKDLINDIIIKFGSSTSPMVIVPKEENENQDYLYLALPVRATKPNN